MDFKRFTMKEEYYSLSAKCEMNRRTVETAKDVVAYINTLQTELDSEISACEEFYKENQDIFLRANKHSSGVSKLLDEENTYYFRQILEVFKTKLSPLSQHLNSLHSKLKVFTLEVENKRKLIDNAKTLKELEDVSLKCTISVNSSLQFKADAMKREWLAMDLKSYVDEYFEALRREVDIEKGLGPKRKKIKLSLD